MGYPYHLFSHATFALLVPLFAGCHTLYAPPTGTPTAQVTVSRGDSPSNQQQILEFLVYGDDQCTKPLGLLGGVVGTLNPTPKVGSLPTGSPVFIRAVSSGVRVGTPLMHFCVNVVRLDLEPGFRYELEQDFSPPTCKVRGRRIGTSESESQSLTLTQLPVAKACKPQ